MATKQGNNLEAETREPTAWRVDRDEKGKWRKLKQYIGTGWSLTLEFT